MIDYCKGGVVMVTEQWMYHAPLYDAVLGTGSIELLSMFVLNTRKHV